MDRLLKYQWQYEPYFPHNPDALVICAVFLGSVALPDQQKIIADKLCEKGFKVDTSKTYKVPYTAINPDRGSVFVDARGSKIQVYVEDKVVYEVEKVTPQASGSAPAESKWDGTYYVSTTNPAYVWVNNGWVERSSAAPAAPNQASAWTWSQQYQRYYRTKTDGTTEWAASASST